MEMLTMFNNFFSFKALAHKIHIIDIEELLIL